ncbi:MAG: alkaline shock response membrane anchor protein AmaP [Planctomycetota bacterium]
MKILSRLMKTSNWLVAIAAGVFGFMWFADRIDLGTISTWAYQINNDNPSMRTILILLAGYLVVFNLAYVLGNIFRRKYASIIKVTVPEGDLTIDVSAIEDSLRRAVKKLPEIAEARVHLYKERKGEKPIRICTTFSAWEDANIKELTDKIQGSIKMRFQEILDVKEPPVFTTILSDIVADKDSRRTESKKRAKERDMAAQRMFYGPEYPVD